MGCCCGGEESQSVIPKEDVPVEKDSYGDGGTKKEKTKSGTEKQIKNSDGRKESGADDSQLIQRTNTEKLDNAIVVHVLQGRKMKAMDAISGKSDPFVVISLDGDGTDKRFQTSISKNTLKPIWNDRFQFQGVGLLSRVRAMKFEVWDWDFNLGLVKDDHIGSVVVDDIQTRQRSRTGLPEWLQVRDEKGEVSGEIQVMITLLEDANTLSRREWTHVLELKVVHGRNLTSLDWIGQSDPYVRVDWGTQMNRTRHIQGSENPEWNEKCYIFVDKTAQASYHLKFTVMDDDLTYDDKIGAGVLPAKEIFEKTEEDGKYQTRINLTDMDVVSDKTFSSDALNELNKTKAREGSLFVEIELFEKERVISKFYDSLVEAYDRNGDGYIDKTEAEQMITLFDITCDAQTFFRKFDDNGDEKWDKKEIRKILDDWGAQDSQWATVMLANFLRNQDIRSKDVSDHLMQGVTQIAMEGCIAVKHRITGLILQENIPSYISWALKLMYSSAAGRAIAEKAQPVLESMSVSKGDQYDSPKSKEEIKPFIELHNLNMEEVIKEPDEFPTFNDFFARAIDFVKYRPMDINENVVVSVADCRMMVWENIADATNVWIKGDKWSVENLLGRERGPKICSSYAGGTLIIQRLAPQDYHRWHWPVTGIVEKITPIDGALYTVNPIAVKKPINVYTENKRCVIEINTGDDMFGTVILVAIAATMVGSYRLFQTDGVKLEEGHKVQRGDVSGEFRFGGSTVLTLLKPGLVTLDPDLVHNSRIPLETLINVRDRVAIKEDPESQDQP